MVTSENQVRHLYVFVDGKTEWKETVAKDAFYLKTVNALGEEERSDIVAKCKVLWAHFTDAKKMERKLSAKQFVLGNVVPGQDYLFKIEFTYYKGFSAENTYAKYAAAYATSASTASTILAELAVNLTKSLSKEIVPPIKVSLLPTAGSTAGKVEVEATKKASDYKGTYAAILVEEIEHPWHLGRMEASPILFNVVPSTINNNHVEEACGTVSDVDLGTAGIIGNGKKTADMEYFLHGERGDIYRGAGYPNDIETKYLVDPSKTYDYLDVHYFTDEANENVQKSEKTLTIVGETSKLATLKSALAAYLTEVSKSVTDVPLPAEE